MARDARDERRRSVRDKARQDAQDVGSGGGSSYIRLPQGFEFQETKAGTNELDILCYEVKSTRYSKASPGELFYRREYKVHRNVGAEKKSYICPTTFGKKCSICSYRDELAKDYKANEKLVGALKPQVKDLYYVDPDGKGKKFKVLDVSHHNFTKKLMEEVREGDEDFVGFADLEKGYTLKVRFVEETFDKSKYLEATRVDFVSRPDYPESILDILPDMDELLVEISDDALNKIFLELDDNQPTQRDDRGREDRGRSRDDDTRETRRSRDDAPLPEEEPPSRGRGRDADPRDEPPARQRNTREEPQPEPEARRGRGREEEKPAEPPARERGRREEPKNDNPCPEGFVYGADADKKDACQKCNVWEKCMDERDRLAAEQKTASGRRG